MSNFSIQVDLAKLSGAQVTDINGKRCVVVPVEENEIFISSRGAAYLSFSANACSASKYGESHIVKRRLSKDSFARMSKEERNAMPILGSMKEFSFSQTQAQAPSQQQNSATSAGNNISDWF
jgi:hypothetical protein